MTCIGWSEKKNTPMRGLWGIGRLVGLAYCQNLAFVTKADGEGVVSRIDWDGRKFRDILSSSDDNMDLASAIQHIVAIKTEKVIPALPGFFEVQMKGIVRHGNDALFNETLVNEYIGQVAPVPFHPDAPFREEIINFLSGYVDVSGYDIFLGESCEPIYRPHRQAFPVSANQKDQFSNLDCIRVAKGNAKPTAIGWVLHHSYYGALKSSPSIRGFRARSGNMQIGNERILSRIFPEERFNNWAVGELHLIDPKIYPNGQRSDFEDTPAFRDVINQLVPLVGRTVANKCRANSSTRNKRKLIEKRLKKMSESLEVLGENLLSKEKRDSVLSDLETELTQIRSNTADFFPKDYNEASDNTDNLSRLISKLKRARRKPPFAHLPKTQQKLVRNIIDLIYDESDEPKAARDLITRIANSVAQDSKKNKH